MRCSIWLLTLFVLIFAGVGPVDGAVDTTIATPGSSFTIAAGASGNTFFGSYQPSYARYDGSGYTTLDVPGGYFTGAQGPVPVYADSSGGVHSFQDQAPGADPPVPEPSTLIVWSLFGAGSWLGMRLRRRRSQPVGRKPWSPEARQAIHEIVGARGDR